MAWLCVDAGTSLIKAVLLDEAGRELAVARQSVPLTRRCPSYAEQDMVTLWQAVVQAAREITQQSIAEVQGIVTTAQGDGCWLVDEAGDPVGPAILWTDGRAHEIVEKWRRTARLRPLSDEADRLLIRGWRTQSGDGWRSMTPAN